MSAGARQPTSEQASRARASPAADRREPLRAGQEIAGGLRLERPLSPRATTWLASDDAGVSWAVKTGPRALIEHEARVLESLSHPHIVRFVRLVRDDESPALVLEYVGGGDLVSLAGAPPAQWTGALEELVVALGYLHGRGLVHRDLKARNVLIDADDRVRLVDFGSALRIGSRWTAGGTTCVAPDRGTAPVGEADDVHALAALVHELIHGAPPGPGRRLVAPGAAAPLAAVADACLESYAGALAAGLEAFRTVIELTHQRSLDQT